MSTFVYEVFIYLKNNFKWRYVRLEFIGGGIEMNIKKTHDSNNILLSTITQTYARIYHVLHADYANYLKIKANYTS